MVAVALVRPPRHLFSGARQPWASRHWPSVAGLQHPLQELDDPIVRRSAEVGAWEAEPNGAVVRVDWQFTTADARTKLRRDYLSVELQ